jgi:hypothetical protein
VHRSLLGAPLIVDARIFELIGVAGKDMGNGSTTVRMVAFALASLAKDNPFSTAAVVSRRLESEYDCT